MKIRCIAIDDEPLALDIIKDYCSKVSFLDLAATFTNPVDSIDYMKNNRTDLMFLDIQMDQLTGIQLLNVVQHKPLVIFTTAYDSFAMIGYEMDVVDYLLKPISFERFIKAANKAYEKVCSDKTPAHESLNVPAEHSIHDYFFVKSEFKIQKVNFNDVLYIEGQSDYLKIVTEKERIMTLMSFRKIEEILPPDDFIRVHKSYIVSMKRIEYIERNRIRIKDQLIPISDTYRTEFFKAVESRSKL